MDVECLEDGSRHVGEQHFQVSIRTREQKLAEVREYDVS